MSNPFLNRSLRKNWLTNPKEVARQSYLAYSRVREEALANEWRDSQALRTQAPGVDVREALQTRMFESLIEIRALVDLHVVLGVTLSDKEKVTLVDTLMRVAEEDALWPVEAGPAPLPETQASPES